MISIFSHGPPLDTCKIKGKTFPPTITAKDRQEGRYNAKLPELGFVYKSINTARSHRYSETRSSIVNSLMMRIIQITAVRNFKMSDLSKSNCGFSAKVKIRRVFKNIHVFEDFLGQFSESK